MESVKSYGKLPEVTVQKHPNGSNTFRINILRRVTEVSEIPTWHSIKAEEPERGRNVLLHIDGFYRIGYLCAYKWEKHKDEFSRLLVISSHGYEPLVAREDIPWMYPPDPMQRTTTVNIYEYDHNKWTDHISNPEFVKKNPEMYLFEGGSITALRQQSIISDGTASTSGTATVGHKGTRNGTLVSRTIDTHFKSDDQVYEFYKLFTREGQTEK